MKRLFFFCVCIQSFIFLSGCHSSRNPVPAETSSQNSTDTAVHAGLYSLWHPDRPWVLHYITGPRISFNGLYPNQHPSFRIHPQQTEIFGSTGCNQFGAALSVDSVNQVLRILEPIRVTEMYCESGMQGETTFLELLKKVDRYALQADSLTLFHGEVALMRFAR